MANFLGDVSSHINNIIVKTLTFSLLPVKETLNFFSKRNLLNDSETTKSNIGKVKHYIDELHKMIISESLKNISISSKYDVLSAYLSMNSLKNSKNKEEKLAIKRTYEKSLAQMSSEIISFFGSTVDNIFGQHNLKSEGIDSLSKKAILDILKLTNPNDTELFKIFDRNFTDLSGLITARKNLYNPKIGSISISDRIVENYITFIKNKITLEENISLFGNNLVLTEDEKKILTIESFDEFASQEGVLKYNLYLGGNISSAKTDSFRGINERINILNNSGKIAIKGKFLKILYKLPLFDISEVQKRIIFKNNKEFIDYLNENIPGIILGMDNASDFLVNFYNNNQSFNLNEIYIKKTSVAGISKDIFGSYNFISDCFKDSNIPDFIPISDLKNNLEKVTVESNIKQTILDSGIIDKSDDCFTALIKIAQHNIIIKKDKINSLKKYLDDSLLCFNKSDDQLSMIKAFLDALNDMYKQVSMFILEKDKKVINIPCDVSFYNKINELNEQTSSYGLYTSVQDYLTKKDYENIKPIDINFGNMLLMNGWDQYKEDERGKILLKKDGKLFIGIKGEGGKNFTTYPKSINNEDYFEKMQYKQFGDVAKNLFGKALPRGKALQSFRNNEKLETKQIESINEFYNIYGLTDEIFEIGKAYSESKDTMSKEQITLLINYFKNWFVKKFGNIYDVSKVQSGTFLTMPELYKTIDECAYKLSYTKISADYVFNEVKEGGLYLFQIHTKDFSEFSKGNENLNTIYLNAALGVTNSKSIRLLGGGSIAFRPAAQNPEIYIDKKGVERIKSKRFYEDKFLIHIPVEISNGGSQTKIYESNDQVNNKIRHQGEKHIIGIDRGENNLITFTVINEKGIIIKRGTLNIINGIDYNKKLKELVNKNKASARAWKGIDEIKGLKTGYCSNAINEIVKLVKEYNAIIVLEQLNTGFKHSRKKIGNEVYTQFERALINKLNFIVDKSDDKNERLTNALQLSPMVDKVTTIDKSLQLGVLFYVDPRNTSTTCPCCGFRKTKSINSSLSQDELIKTISEITVKKCDDKYNISYSTTNKDKITRSHTLSSDIFRLVYDTNNKSNKTIDITLELDNLFTRTATPLTGNIINGFLEKAKLTDLKSFSFIFNTLVSIRNSDTATSVDRIACPSCGFDSIDGFQGDLFDGDINGAYNIARKGLVLVKKIQSTEHGIKPDIIVRDEEFDNEVVK